MHRAFNLWSANGGRLCSAGQELLAKAENFFYSLAGISVEELSSLDNFSDQAHVLDGPCYCRVSHHGQPERTDLMRLLLLLQDPTHTLMSHYFMSYPVLVDDDNKENTTRPTPKRGLPLAHDDEDDLEIWDCDPEDTPLRERMNNMGLETPSGRAGAHKAAKKAIKQLTPQQLQKLK